VLALLAAGIFIGLSINKDSLVSRKRSLQKKSPTIPPPLSLTPKAIGPASSSTPVRQTFLYGHNQFNNADSGRNDGHHTQKTGWPQRKIPTAQKTVRCASRC